MKYIIVLFGILVFFAVDFGYFIMMPLNHNKPFVIEVRAGNSATDVIKTLKQEGITARPLYLTLLIKILKIENKLQTGYYEFEQSVTPKKFLKLVMSGEVAVLKFTIVEGSTWHDLLSLFAELEGFQNIDIIKQPSITSLTKMYGSLDGLFYPDTYYYHRGDNPVALLKKAHDKMTQVLEVHWTNRAKNLPYQNAQEALIAASIVEKESADPIERQLIAHIVMERLKKRMKLQLDPTVVYAQKLSNPAFKTVNIKFDSPYNTYLYYGLPPGPICYPSLDAIKATMQPKANAYLYFVSNGHGKHIFSTSLKEHQKNVNKLRKLLNNPQALAHEEQVI